MSNDKFGFETLRHIAIGLCAGICLAFPSDTKAQDTIAPELVAGLGHENQIVDIAHSPDNRLIATTGWGGVTWIWDAETDRAIFRFDWPQDTESQALLKFSADSRFLYVLGTDRMYKVDIAARRLVEELPFQVPVIGTRYSSFSSLDSTFGSLVSTSGFLRCGRRGCDAFTEEKPDQKTNLLWFENDASVVETCPKFVVGYNSGEYYYRPEQSKLMIAQSQSPDEVITVPFPEEILSFTCTRDNHFIAGSWDGKLFRIDSSGAVVNTTELPASTLQELMTLPSGEIMVASSAVLNELPVQVFVLQPDTLEVVRKTSFPEDVMSITKLAPSPDPTQVFVAYNFFSDQPPEISRVSLLDLTRTDGPSPAIRPARHVRFDDTGNNLVVATNEDAFVWELEAGRALPGVKMNPYSIPRLRNGSLYFITLEQQLQRQDLDGTTTTFDLPTDLPPYLWPDAQPTFSGSTLALGFAADGNRLGGHILWRDALGAQAAFQAVVVPAGVENSTTPPEFSPDGKFLAQGVSGGIFQTSNGFEAKNSIEMYDTSEFPPKRIWTSISDDWSAYGGRIGDFGPGYTPDGDHLVLSAGSKDTLGLVMLDVLTGKEVAFRPEAVPVHVSPSGLETNMAMILKLNPNGDAHFSHGLADATQRIVPLLGVFPNVAVTDSKGRALLVSDGDGKVLLWTAARGQSLVLNASVDTLSNVSFSPNGELLALVETDGSTSLWCVETGELITRLLILANGDWVVVDGDGRYDAADPGDVAGLSWILPSDPLTPEPIETYYLDYYEPRLLSRRILAESFLPLPLPSERNRVTPEIRISEIAPAGKNAQGVAVVNVEVDVYQKIRKGQESGLGDIKLFRDGRLVEISQDRVFDSEGVARIRFQDVMVPMDRTSFEFSAYAFNDDGIKSETSSLEFQRTEAAISLDRRAYVIGIGVNAYDNAAWNLRYAASDAEASVALVAEGLRGSGQFGEVLEIPLVSRTDGSKRMASREVIQAVLNRLAGGQNAEGLSAEALALVKELSPARPQDLVYLAFAGHGLATPDGQFHFFPQEFGAGQASRVVDEQALSQTLKSDQLAELLMQIDVRDMMLVVDACNSAASVEGSGFRPGPMGSRGLGQLAYDKSMRVLTASQSENVALESERLLHGALSYALLREGLEAQHADVFPKNGAISFTEMFRFASERVPKLYAELQSDSFQPLSRGGFSFSEEIEPVESKVQRPALFDFRRPEEGRIEMVFN